MDAPTTPRVALMFGSARVEIDSSLASRRGGLRAFAREAEQLWSLHAHSYDFFDSRGNKVDSYPALQAALSGSQATDVCTFEVRERPEGTMLRQALQTFKAEILEKVAAALTEVQGDVDHIHKKLNNCLAPMVQNIAMEQMDMRTKLDAMNDEALAERTEYLESFEDLRIKLDSMNDEGLAEREEYLQSFEELISKTDAMVSEARFEELIKKTNAMVDESMEERDEYLSSIEAMESKIASLEASSRSTVKQLEQLDEELQMEFDSARDVDAAPQEDDVEALRAAVRGLDDIRAARLDATVGSGKQEFAKASQIASSAKKEAAKEVKEPACKLDTMVAAKPAKEAARPSFLEAAWKPLPASFGSISYSSKASYEAPSAFSYGNKLHAGGLTKESAFTAPFAQCTAAPRLRSSMSVPLLGH